MKPNGEMRIGVYICHCGTNIAQTVDVRAVADYAATLPHVVKVREYKYMCSDPGQELIKKDVEDDRLTHVVVSSCSPLMHEETFREACQDAGLNRFLFQMSNIREQCSWVHEDRVKATAKAQRLVAAAVRRVGRHRALDRDEVPVRQEALVVGAGIAGIEAALRLADSGKKVYLVEKQPSIGGHMARFDKTFPTLDCAACILTPKMVQVGHHPNIELMTWTEAKEVSGYVGNFKVKLRRKARYVDEAKCTGCGQCLERCPVRFDPIRDTARLESPPPDPEPGLKALLDAILEKHQGDPGPVVSILQDLNLQWGHLPEIALRHVAWSLKIPAAWVYHVATFYKAFSMTPRGRHVIKVCMGTACHVRGSSRLLETFESRLEVRAGQTTADRMFTLETVNCLGACAMGPVVVVGEKFMTLRPGQVEGLVARLSREPVGV